MKVNDFRVRIGGSSLDEGSLGFSIKDRLIFYRR